MFSGQAQGASVGVELPPHFPKDDLLAFYPLTSNGRDISGNNRHAEVRNSPVFSPDDGVILNGIDQLVLFPSFGALLDTKGSFFWSVKSLDAYPSIALVMCLSQWADNPTESANLTIGLGNLTGHLSDESLTAILYRDGLQKYRKYHRGGEGKYINEVQHHFGIKRTFGTTALEFWHNGVILAQSAGKDDTNDFLKIANSNRLSVGGRRLDSGGIIENHYSLYAKNYAFYGEALSDELMASITGGEAA